VVPIDQHTVYQKGQPFDSLVGNSPVRSVLGTLRPVSELLTTRKRFRGLAVDPSRLTNFTLGMTRAKKTKKTTCIPGEIEVNKPQGTVNIKSLLGAGQATGGAGKWGRKRIERLKGRRARELQYWARPRSSLNLWWGIRVPERPRSMARRHQHEA
jgi:hypothetical protein